jgi:hypothetical protein
MKRFLGIGIVLFWLVMVGLLSRRTTVESQSADTPASPITPVQTNGRLAAHDGWMGIYHQERKIGYFHRSLKPIENGYQWQERSQMKLRVMNTDQNVHTEVQANIDQQYALRDFSFRLVSSGAVFHVAGEVQTNGENKQELRGQITTGGNSSPFSFLLQEPLYLPTITQLTLHGMVPQLGDERRYNIFNPLTAKTETIQVTAIGHEDLSIKGRSIATTKLAEQFGGTTVHAWIDHEGKVVKEEAALGLTLLRESQSEALNDGWSDNTPLDLVSSAAIPVQKTLPNPRELSHLQLTVSGPTEIASFAFPPRQHYHDGTLTVTNETLATLASYQLPASDAALASDLVATPFLQSDHPRIKQQLQQILAGEQDARQAVHKLLDWVYITLDKEPTVGIPTALEALHSKKGDCNEHAVLFTALARATGIPSRVAAGVVYMDGAFYYHAWSEVWLGQWVAVDPVFNQFPADATHVKFIQGGPEEHMALLKIIGQVRMEVIEYH